MADRRSVRVYAKGSARHAGPQQQVRSVAVGEALDAAEYVRQALEAAPRCHGGPCVLCPDCGEWKPGTCFRAHAPHVCQKKGGAQ